MTVSLLRQGCLKRRTEHCTPLIHMWWNDMVLSPTFVPWGCMVWTLWLYLSMGQIIFCLYRSWSLSFSNMDFFLTNYRFWVDQTLNFNKLIAVFFHKFCIKIHSIGSFVRKWGGFSYPHKKIQIAILSVPSISPEVLGKLWRSLC